MNKLRSEAEKLRSQGYSYNLIHEKLGISKSTMSYWFKEKEFTPNQEVLDRIKFGPGKIGIQRHNQRVQEIEKLRQIGIQELGRLSKRDLWLLGLGIYIGEGAKTIEAIRISNSDPAVVKICIRWLKEICNVPSLNLRIRIHMYPDMNYDECLKYWQSITGLSASNFYQSSIDTRNKKQAAKSHKLPYGTVHISVLSNGDYTKGVRLFRKLNGWITGALNQV